MLKWGFLLGLIAAGVFVGGQVIPVYYNNMKIENVFEGVTTSLADQNVSKVKGRMFELLDIQNIDRKSLPKTFFENLEVTKDEGKLQVGSTYHIRLWLLGEPKSVNPDQDYKESDVKGMDKLRLKLRMDFDFAPFAETP